MMNDVRFTLPNATVLASASLKIEHTSAPLCSGQGQFHSPENSRNPQPYINVTIDQIRAMAANPPSVAKESAQWAIFSALLSRVHSEQRAHGKFYALWADIDEPAGLSMPEIAMRAQNALEGAQVIGYTTRSATESKQKCRIIVPLAEPVSGDDFVRLQRIFNDKLAALGVEPDRATERAGQVCYLPNSGDFYDFTITTRPVFSQSVWGAEIEATKQQETSNHAAQNVALKAAKARAINRIASGEKSPINAFNAEFDLPTMLERFGYQKRGNRYCSPLSQSGKAGVSLTEDGKRWLSAHSSDAGIGKPNSNGTSGDAFDLFVFFRHGGNADAALKAAGEMLTTQNGTSITKANQRDYAQSQADKRTEIAGFELTRSKDSEKNFNEPAALFDFSKFSINGDLEAMKQKMLNDVFVLGELALLGQITLIYAEPNTGKTLLTIRLLIDAVKNGQIKGEDVFFVNADDSYNGLIQKAELMAKHGINSIAPGENDFNTKHFLDYLDLMIRQDSARGKVIVLDTLKKFTNLMDKTVASGFMSKARLFTSKGGTMILLAHTNKRRDPAGGLVVGGTSDARDDADCVYTLDEIEKPQTTKTVLFENKKARGNVARQAAYTYSTEREQTYEEMLDSVTSLNEKEREKVAREKALQDAREKDKPAIDAISEAIRLGFNQQTELLKKAYELSGISKKLLNKILKQYEGSSSVEGKEWASERGGHNALTYQLHYGSIIGATSREAAEAGMRQNC